jgi:small conductance mechanosensitive channel
MKDITSVTDTVTDTVSETVTDIAEMPDKVMTILHSNAFAIAMTVVIGFIVSKIVIAILDKVIAKFRIEKTLLRFFRSVLRVVVYFIWVLVVARQANYDAKYIVTLASVLSAAFALAAQGTLSNLFGGMLLLMTKPFLVGDYVIAGGVEGTVLEISLLNTKINSIDNKRITVPNSTISGATITNCSTEGMRRVDMTFSAHYDEPTEKVKKAIHEAIDQIPMILEEPAPPFVRISAYNDSSISYLVRAWTTTEDYWDVYFDLLEKVRETYARNGVEMPYNQMVVHMK